MRTYVRMQLGLDSADRLAAALDEAQEPLALAAAARLLVSEAGAYINGQMIQVNGGADT